MIGFFERNQMIYSRAQGSIVFNFYIDTEGKLRAETICKGKREAEGFVRGLPWMEGLFDQTGGRPSLTAPGNLQYIGDGKRNEERENKKEAYQSYRKNLI